MLLILFKNETRFAFFSTANHAIPKQLFHKWNYSEKWKYHRKIISCKFTFDKTVFHKRFMRGVFDFLSLRNSENSHNGHLIVLSFLFLYLQACLRGFLIMSCHNHHLQPGRSQNYRVASLRNFFLPFTAQNIKAILHTCEYFLYNLLFPQLWVIILWDLCLLASSSF